MLLRTLLGKYTHKTFACEFRYASTGKRRSINISTRFLEQGTLAWIDPESDFCLCCENYGKIQNKTQNLRLDRMPSAWIKRSALNTPTFQSLGLPSKRLAKDKFSLSVQPEIFDALSLLRLEYSEQSSNAEDDASISGTDP